MGCGYSHCDFVLPDGSLLGALPDGGVQIRQPRTDYKRKLLVEIPVKNGHKFAQQQTGRPYDWLAVLALSSPFPVERNWRDSNYFFCSELAFMSIQVAGLNMLHPQSWGVTPRDLLLSPFWKPVD